MTTLTDRYVWAVVRNLPESDRAGVDLELRDLIAEMVESRHDTPTGEATGDGPGDPERDVIVELGNPNRLAARYVATPRALIGASLFPEYLRVLKLVWIIAVPLVTALAVAGELIDGDPTVGGVIGMLFAGAYGSTVLVAFWVTLVYAALDRSSYQLDWTPDLLPAAPRDPDNTFRVGDTVFTLVVIALTATALVWQQLWPSLDDADGNGVPFLDPDLWDGAAQALLVLLGASFVVSAVALARRRWTFTLAWINAAVDVAFFAVVAWLALDERLINEQFLETLADRADWDTVPSINPWLIVVIAGAIEIWDIVDGFVRARRQRH